MVLSSVAADCPLLYTCVIDWVETTSKDLDSSMVGNTSAALEYLY